MSDQDLIAREAEGRKTTQTDAGKAALENASINKAPLINVSEPKGELSNETIRKAQEAVQQTKFVPQSQVSSEPDPSRVDPGTRTKDPAPIDAGKAGAAAHHPVSAPQVGEDDKFGAQAVNASSDAVRSTNKQASSFTRQTVDANQNK